MVCLSNKKADINLYISNLKVLSTFTSAVYIQVHLRLDFFMEANSMNPDQTGPNQQSNIKTTL